MNMKSIENKLESLMFNSRWLLAPFYIGLILAIVIPPGGPTAWP